MPNVCPEYRSKALELPRSPTIYDHLVLSFREQDLIATFNWDPLLLQAYRRNAHLGLKLPRLAFLHGCVATGYYLKDRVVGYAESSCRHCGEEFKRAPLLYPIKKKNYAANEFIASEWQALKFHIEHAFMITIFGYSGPKSDEEAIAAMKEAWESRERSLEQTAFITLQSDSEITANWKPFIYSHHYEVHSSFCDSWIATHPRRTGEAIWRLNSWMETRSPAMPISTTSGLGTNDLENQKTSIKNENNAGWRIRDGESGTA